MVEQDGDIFGEGVNIAARLEGVAEPGGICISRRVQEEVCRKGSMLGFEDHRRADAEEHRAAGPRLSAAANGSATRASARAQPSLPDKPSIAVLPFQNMSGDPEQEYFADGMVEDIITALSRMRWLFVIARNSSFTYKGRAVDVKQVGRELGVRYVLEGSVRKAGNRVRITGQLIDAVDRRASLGRPLRRRTGGHLRSAGPGDGKRRRRDRAEARAGGDRAGQAQADREPRRLRLFPARHGRLSPIQQGGERRGAGDVHPRDRTSIRRYASAYGMAARCYLQRKGFGWVADPRTRSRRGSNGWRARAAELGRDDAVALCAAGFALVIVVRRSR